LTWKGLNWDDAIDDIIAANWGEFCFAWLWNCMFHPRNTALFDTQQQLMA
jgi:hypothetical protein